jgi:hypothetical protein
MTGPPSRRRITGAARALVAAASAVGSLGLAVAVPALTDPLPAGAEPVADCSTTVGVVVAVDLSPWGGAVERGCDAAPSTALAALQADFSVDGTAQYGDAFVCRIDGDPTVDQTPCTSTPPASASWSFWYADAGSTSWTYATEGASTFRPQAGSAEAWTFGAAGTVPAFAPAAVRATNTSPAAGGGPGATTTTAPPSSPSGATPAPTSPVGPQAPAPTGAGGTPTPTPATDPASPASPAGGAGTTRTTAVGGATSSPTTTVPPGTPVPSRTGPTGHGRHPIIDAAPASLHATPAGSPVPLAVGAVLVVAVAGVAGALAWRRRRAP